MPELSEKYFHRLYLFFLFTLSLGAALDGREHALQGGIETFFTVGHSIAYGSVMLIALLFGVLLSYRYLHGASIREAVPDGYQLTALSIPLFFLGGLGDMVWHMFFGFETTALEVMSPTHLAILSFGIFIASGPLRRAWYRGADSWKQQFYALSSAAFILWIINYGQLPIHPFVEAFAASWHPESAKMLAGHGSIAGLFMTSIILMSFILLLIERFDIVPGGFTYLVGLYTILMTIVSDNLVFLPVGLATGLAADILYKYLSPKTDRHIRFRIFAFLVPFIYIGLYFLSIHLTDRVVWSVHTWAGSIVFCGIGGVLISYLIYPSSREK